MSSTQVLPISLDEFHRLYDGRKPAYEYWEGEPIQKQMPTDLHGLLQYLLMKLLGDAGWLPRSEVRLKVVPEFELVPDIIATHDKIKGNYPNQGPELCIEILSPDDRLSIALEKAERYIAWGTQTVWAIDPNKRTAWIITKDGIGWIAPEGSLVAGQTVIDLPVLFEQVDKSLEP